MNVVFSGLIDVSRSIQTAMASIPAFRVSGGGVGIALETPTLGQAAGNGVTVGIKFCLPLWITLCFLATLVGLGVCAGCSDRPEKVKACKHFEYSRMHYDQLDTGAYEKFLMSLSLRNDDGMNSPVKVCRALSSEDWDLNV